MVCVMLRRVGRTIGATTEPTIDSASGFWSLEEVRKFIQEFKWPMGSKASGGTVTQDGDYTIHTFTSDGTLDILSIGSYGFDVLVVAGGGGGGSGAGGIGEGPGGGGAGGVLYYTRTAQIPVGSYAVTVGSGGASFSSGGNSSIGSVLTAIGGGRGGRASNSSAGLAGSGGSGGGGNGAFNVYVQGGSGTSGQGFSGGSGQWWNGSGGYKGGGGGGGASGGGGTGVTNAGGDGGNGRQFDISGTSTYYGGGGGGTVDNNGGAGGLGGGADGSSSGNSATGASGTANTGGGGGGAGRGGGAGGSGGSGIVIVRYKKYAAGEGTLANPFKSPVEAQTVGATSGTSYYFYNDTMREPRQLEYQDNYFDGKPWVKVFSSPYASTATVNELNYYIPFDGLLVERSTQDIRAGGYTTNIGRKLYNNNLSGFTGMDMSSANTVTAYGKVMLGYTGGHGFYGSYQSRCNWGNSIGGVGAGYNGSTCGTSINNLVWGTGTSGSTYTNRSGTWHHWVYWT